MTSGVTIDGGVIGDVTLDAAGFFGLSFIAGTSTVRDLVLVRSAAGGVNVSGTARVSVLDNIIGTDILGAPGLGNAYGVHLDAPDAVVRGNVISGNTNAGVELSDAARAAIAGRRPRLTNSMASTRLFTPLPSTDERVAGLHLASADRASRILP